MNKDEFKDKFGVPLADAKAYAAKHKIETVAAVTELIKNEYAYDCQVSATVTSGGEKG